jgi:SynChlorMet cassette radical SAM/SPASM protein ScmF
MPKYQTETRRYPALDFQLFESILEQAKPLGLASIKLTGGEPLLHPKISEILDLLCATDIRVIVETNGILCTPEIARQMAACKNPFVAVSLDGADAETHEWLRGVNGCFEAALEAIRNLVEAGLKPQVIMSLVRRNKDQMEPVVRLAESLGAGSIKFNILQPIARAADLQEHGRTLDMEELVELGEWVERDLCGRTHLRLHYSHPLVFRPLGRMLREDGSGCAGCAILSILGVLADGSYAMCGIGETVPELVYGHAATDRLQDIWTDSPVLVELRAGLPQSLQGSCAQCMVRDICRGFCVARNYQESGSLWGAYWYCEEAWHKGLFPESRIRPQSSGQALVGGQTSSMGYLKALR